MPLVLLPQQRRQLDLFERQQPRSRNYEQQQRPSTQHLQHMKPVEKQTRTTITKKTNKT
jgi:hypothetical protein